MALIISYLLFLFETIKHFQIFTYSFFFFLKQNMGKSTGANIKLFAIHSVHLDQKPKSETKLNIIFNNRNTCYSPTPT